MAKGGRLGTPVSLEEVRLRRGELHGAIVALEAALATPAASPTWPGRVRAALDELRWALEDHVAVTEGSGGLFEQIVEERPRLASAVSALRDEHGGFRHDAGAARRSLDVGVDPAVLRAELGDLLARLIRHRQRGSDLVHEAYQVDIGGSSG